MRLSDKTNTLPIPFRDSKLTRVLRPSLESNTKIVIICNISPAAGALEETISTLEFAKRAKKVKQIVAKNDTSGTKMLILKYENEISHLQQKLKEMEQHAIIGIQSHELKQEIGVIKEQLTLEKTEKARISEAFEQALIERTQLEEEIAKLKSRILVSESLDVEPVEPMLGRTLPLDRRIMRLTITRNPIEHEQIKPEEMIRTSSIMALNREDFCKKTMDSPEEAIKFNQILTEYDNVPNDFLQDYSVRDTMLVDKIGNVHELFEGFFDPRNSVTMNGSVRDSFAFFNNSEFKEDEKNLPSREQLMQIISEQDEFIKRLQIESEEKNEHIETLKDELVLCRNNMKELQKHIKEMRQGSRKY